MDDLRSIDRLVLDKLLAGHVSILEALREQASDARVSARRHSTAGEYVDLVVSQEHPLVDPPDIVLGDLDLQVAGVEHGVATLLYIAGGRLAFIEYATYSDIWPVNPEVRGCNYLRETEEAPQSYSLVPVQERDEATLRRALGGHRNAFG